MLRFIFLFLVISMQLSTRSLASDEDCGSNIRLDEMERSMAHVPVLDQDGTGLCYAYAAAQLVDAYRFSHGDQDYSHLTSPLIASVDEAKDSTSTKFSSASTGKELARRFSPSTSISGTSSENIKPGGLPDSVISAIAKNGSCRNEVVQSYVNGKDEKSFLDLLLSRFDEHQNYLKQTRFFERLGKSSPVEDSLVCDLKNSMIGKNISQLTSVVRLSLKSSNPLEFFKKIAEGICQGQRKQVPALKPFSVYGYEMLQHGVKPEIGFRRILNRHLNKPNPQPIGIGICAQSLRNDIYSTRLNYGEPDPMCETHVVLVVGRRTNADGQCEFLIRDSAGTSCEFYRSKFFKRDCIDGTGQIWVPATTLDKTISGAFGIEDT